MNQSNSENHIPTTGKDIEHTIDPQSGRQSMSGFDEEFTNVVDYILRITDRIWKEKNIGSIARYYAPDSVIHTLGGPVYGSEAVIQNTIQTLAAFPDRRLQAENVIWSGSDKEGFYTSHRIISPEMTNLGHSEFGSPTGKQATVRTLVDCFVKDNQVHEEWLMRDNKGLVQQLGFDPAAVAQQLAEVDRDNTQLHSWLASEIDRLRSITFDTNSRPLPKPADSLNEFIEIVFNKIWYQQDSGTIETVYSPDCQFHGPAGRELQGHKEINTYVAEILNTLSNIRVCIDHVCSIPYQDNNLDIAIRWTLTGLHDKQGIYDAPCHQDLLILGCTHWRLIEDKIAEEWTVFDELAVLRQVYAKT
jgi:predicted ester cyclase